jgi:hypothetical protein
MILRLGETVVTAKCPGGNALQRPVILSTSTALKPSGYILTPEGVKTASTRFLQLAQVFFQAARVSVIVFAGANWVGLTKM